MNHAKFPRFYIMRKELDCAYGRFHQLHTMEEAMAACMMIKMEGTFTPVSIWCVPYMSGDMTLIKVLGE